MDEREQLLRRAYDAFNTRDIDGTLALMHRDVDWPNALEGGRLRGHDEVRRYWLLQFATIDPTVEPVAFTTDGEGRTAVDVHQVVRACAGALLSDQHVTHVYEFRDGLIERMEIAEAETA